MTDPRADDTTTARARRLVRREPPRFRRVTVEDVEARSPLLTGVRLAGPELDGLTVDQPAASVRLLLPPAGGDRLVMPEWNGNEFLLPSGDRPLIRTLTPRRLHPDAPALDLEIVLHDGGAASAWAAEATVGDDVAVAGTGRGFEIDPDVPAYVLGGDESAVPAISQLLEWIPGTARVDVHIEARADARLDLPDHPGARVTWHTHDPDAAPGEELVAAMASLEIDDEAHVWVAGEAAAVQRIRKLLGERDVPRSRATVRGYWKRGRAEN